MSCDTIAFREISILTDLVPAFVFSNGARVLYEFAARAPVGSARAQLAFGQDSRFSALRSPSQHDSGG